MRSAAQPTVDPEGPRPTITGAKRDWLDSRTPDWKANLRRVLDRYSTGETILDLDPALQRWVNQQVRGLRRDWVASDTRRQLAEAGITERTPTSTEAVLLREIDRWVATHGHTSIPARARTDLPGGQHFPLGSRVTEVRVHHGKGKVSPALLHELSQRPGWKWSGRSDSARAGKPARAKGKRSVKGGPAREFVEFALDGENFMVDLSTADARRLRRRLAKFIKGARPVVRDALASPSRTDVELLKLGIEKLELTARAYNCLMGEGIRTVGELVARSEADLRDIRMMGSGSVNEVKMELVRLNLTLKEARPPAVQLPS
jgi:hypothetical protein